MNPMKLQNVRAALAELEDDPEYQSLGDSGLDERFNEFRQEVEITGIRCLELQPDPPSPEEIDERLTRLYNHCTGTLARFRPFIKRAQAALHGA